MKKPGIENIPGPEYVTTSDEGDLLAMLRRRHEFLMEKVRTGQMTMAIVDGEPVYTRVPPKAIFAMDSADGREVVTLDEVIVGLATELGNLTLFGSAQYGDGWIFGLHVGDQTAELLDDPTIDAKSGVVRSWNAAVELLDIYPWHHLSLRRVHQQFRRLVWDEAMRRHATDPMSDRTRNQWEELLAQA